MTTDTERLLTAVKELDTTFSKHQTKFDKRVDELQARIDERESAEALADRPAANSNKSGYTAEQREHKDVFTEWLRKPNDGIRKRRMDETNEEITSKWAKEGKAVTVGTASAGGYAVPEILDSQIEARVNLLNPFRTLVRQVTVGSRDWKALVSSNDGSNGWVGEGDSRTETTTSRLFERQPTFGTIYSYPKASEESMQDIFFDVGAWLTEEAGDGFASAEASAIVSGNGTNKPTGFLNSTSSSADNSSPERSAAALQFITPAASSPTVTLTGLADALISLAYTPKERYLLDAESVAFVMRRSTAATVRKLKDPSTGAYLWGESLVQGQPPTLLGYPVRLTDAMPSIANDAIPIAFGNWRRGYVLADRVGSMQITVDNNITTPGQVKFYLRRVVGGCVYNHEALKLLKVSD